MAVALSLTPTTAERASVINGGDPCTGKSGTRYCDDHGGTCKTSFPEYQSGTPTSATAGTSETKCSSNVIYCGATTITPPKSGCKGGG